MSFNSTATRWIEFDIIEFDSSESKCGVKVDAYSYTTLMRLFESDDCKLTRFPSDRLDDDSLCLCNVWEKEQLAIKLLDDFSVKIIVPRDSADSFNVAMKS